jgi:hypothetical protein
MDDGDKIKTKADDGGDAEKKVEAATGKIEKEKEMEKEKEGRTEKDKCKKRRKDFTFFVRRSAIFQTDFFFNIPYMFS